jgi:hypothetical protein
MAVKLTTVKQSTQENGLKILVHAPAGVGKTRLMSTIDEPFVIISCEGGLLSIAEHCPDAPVIEITEFKDLDDAYNIVTGPDGGAFKWVVLDSFSEIAEVCLVAEKKSKPDPRQAYGTTQDKVYMMLRKFRDIPGKNVYFISKTDRFKDEKTGAMMYQPSMPGNALKQGVAYHFDEVFALRIVDDGNGGTVRALQTGRDLEFEAKDRSGKLAPFEPADLSHIRRKILGAAA